MRVRRKGGGSGTHVPFQSLVIAEQDVHGEPRHPRVDLVLSAVAEGVAIAIVLGTEEATVPARVLGCSGSTLGHDSNVPVRSYDLPTQRSSAVGHSIPRGGFGEPCSGACCISADP